MNPLFGDADESDEVPFLNDQPQLQSYVPKQLEDGKKILAPKKGLFDEEEDDERERAVKQEQLKKEKAKAELDAENKRKIDAERLRKEREADIFKTSHGEIEGVEKSHDDGNDDIDNDLFKPDDEEDEKEILKKKKAGYQGLFIPQDALVGEGDTSNVKRSDEKYDDLLEQTDLSALEMKLKSTDLVTQEELLEKKKKAPKIAEQPQQQQEQKKQLQSQVFSKNNAVVDDDDLFSMVDKPTTDSKSNIDLSTLDMSSYISKNKQQQGGLFD